MTKRSPWAAARVRSAVGVRAFSRAPRATCSQTPVVASCHGHPERAAPTAEGDLDRQVEAAVARWRGSGEFTEQTLLRSEETRRPVRPPPPRPGRHRRSRQITPRTARGSSTPSPARGGPGTATRHARRVALRMLFRTLRETRLSGRRPDPGPDPAAADQPGRPAADRRRGHPVPGRHPAGRGRQRLAAAGGCWALAEATAVTSEISAVRLGDLDDPDQPRWVQLPGTRRVDPRLGELTDWGSRDRGPAGRAAARARDLPAHDPADLPRHRDARPARRPGRGLQRHRRRAGRRRARRRARRATRQRPQLGRPRRSTTPACRSSRSPAGSAPGRLDAAAEDIALDWRHRHHEPQRPLRAEP